MLYALVGRGKVQEAAPVPQREGPLMVRFAVRITLRRGKSQRSWLTGFNVGRKQVKSPGVWVKPKKGK